MSNYTKECWKDSQVELFDYAMGKVKKIKNNLCAKDTEIREEYLTHMPCIRTLTVRKDKPCMNDMMAGIEAVVAAKMNQRIGLGCCVANRAQSCYLEEIEEACGLDARVFMVKVKRIAMSRMPEYICEDAVPGSAMCADLPPEGSKMTGVKSRFKLLSALMYSMKRRD